MFWLECKCIASLRPSHIHYQHKSAPVLGSNLYHWGPLGIHLVPCVPAYYSWRFPILKETIPNPTVDCLTTCLGLSLERKLLLRTWCDQNLLTPQLPEPRRELVASLLRVPLWPLPQIARGQNSHKGRHPEKVNQTKKWLRSDSGNRPQSDGKDPPPVKILQKYFAESIRCKFWGGYGKIM